MNKREFFTVEELASLLRVNKRTIYRLVSNGKIPAFRIGKSWRISSEYLLKLAKKTYVDETSD